MPEKIGEFSTDVKEFSESGGTDPSDSSRISSNDSDGNEELRVQPYLYEPETNTEGNANITVLFYEITERVESKFWSFKKTQNVYNAYFGQVLCGSQIGNLLSVRHKFYVNEGVWACRNAPLKLKI